MQVSVVVPTHKRKDSLAELLESIENQTLDKNSFEVLIVSNFKEAWLNDSEFRSRWSSMNMRVEAVGRKGVNRARNRGLKSAQASLVLFLDDDCYLDDQEYLEKILSVHSTYPEAVAIGGCYGVSPEAKALDKAYNCLSRHWQALDHFGSYDSIRLVGGNVSYKKNLILAKGLFLNEAIQFGGTEAEFHKRLQQAGLSCLYLDALEVQHRTHLSTQDLVKKAVNQARGHLNFDIDKGFSKDHYSTWQPLRLIRARKLAKSKAELEEILQSLFIYDKAYQLLCDNPAMEDDKAMKKAVKVAGRQWEKGVSL